jgi:hypothetical protein
MSDSKSAYSLKNAIISPTGFGFGIVIGLWFPDIDLAVMPIFHHRSIITHSILLPGLLLLYTAHLVPAKHAYAKRVVALDTAAGFMMGTAIHLAADILSPMRGFSLIYLPGIRTSIGVELSYLWIGGNMLLGAYLSLKYAKGHGATLFILTLAIALAYAVFNELAVAPFVITGIILTLSGLAIRWQRSPAQRS